MERSTDEVNYNCGNSSQISKPSLRVGAYYYPWYGGTFHGKKYPRGELVPRQQPWLGEYDDHSLAVIAQHIHWSRMAGVQVWVASWWGPQDQTDQTLLQHILPSIAASSSSTSLHVSLFYETEGRILPQTDHSSWNLSTVQADLQYIALNYFGDPQYYRINERPVIFVYVTRSLNSRRLLGTVIDLMRSGAAAAGYNDIYIMGDQVWSDAPMDSVNYQPFQLLDGVTTYDVYGNLKTSGKLYAGQTGVDRYQAKQEAWLQATKDSGTSCAFVPSITPGFNKLGDLVPMSRKIDESSENGSLFRSLLRNSFNITDIRADNLVMITSFNEWHEDTQIEPVDPQGGTTTEPVSITGGLTYDAYGSLYLEILRQELIGYYCPGWLSDTGGGDECCSTMIPLSLQSTESWEPTIQQTNMGEGSSGCIMLYVHARLCLVIMGLFFIWGRQRSIHKL
jgi:hypothetical protein